MSRISSSCQNNRGFVFVCLGLTAYEFSTWLYDHLHGIWLGNWLAYIQAMKLEDQVMSAAIIDTTALNSLFDNQKRLDDVFDSIFNDDNYFICSVSSTPSAGNGSTHNTSRSYTPKQSPVKGSLLMIKARFPYFFMLPIVLELAAIYVLVTNLL